MITQALNGVYLGVGFALGSAVINVVCLRLARALSGGSK